MSRRRCHVLRIFIHSAYALFYVNLRGRKPARDGFKPKFAGARPRYPIRINAPPSSLCDGASIDALRKVAPRSPLLSPDLKQNPVLIGQAINFLAEHVNDEWTTVGGGGVLVVRESGLRKVTFVIEEVLNLAYALWCCRKHPDLQRLITKLKSD